MDPAVGVNILYRIKEEDDPERFKELLADLERDTKPWNLANLYEAQRIVDPRDTRSVLLQMLEIYRLRLNKGVSKHLLRNWPTSC